MKTKKPLTVTIGVPAYNEEVNITNLLNSVLKQKGKLFQLEKIIVVCDGCTDNTAEKVLSIAKKNPIIRLINDNERIGKAQRLNQLYQINTSDIIIALDCDSVLRETKFIDKIVSAFDDKNIVVVAGNNQPVKAKNLIEKIYNAGFQMWYEIRKDYHGGDTINNLQGPLVALRKSFSKSFKYPKGTVSDGGFLYMKIKKEKRQFHFAQDAIAFIPSVGNLGEFFSQATRNINEKHMLVKQFGSSVYSEYRVPTRYKVQGIAKALYHDPFFTLIAILFNIWLRVLSVKEVMFQKDKVEHSGIY